MGKKSAWRRRFCRSSRRSLECVLTGTRFSRCHNRRLSTHAATTRSRLEQVKGADLSPVFAKPWLLPLQNLGGSADNADQHIMPFLAVFYSPDGDLGYGDGLGKGRQAG